MNVSPSFTFFFSIQRSGEKPFTSPAMRQAWFEASKRVMGAMPLFPAQIALQVLSVSGPHGLTAPMPVMTTLRMTAQATDYHGFRGLSYSRRLSETRNTRRPSG